METPPQPRPEPEERRSRGLHVVAGDRTLWIPSESLHWRFARSSGPGGQHVNRTSSKAMLHFDVAGCPGLPDDVRRRLCRRLGPRITATGQLVIVSQRHRQRPRNVADCRAKLAALLSEALVAPPVRKRTRKPRSAERSRLDTKRRRSRTKQLRRGPNE
jgi:ribosome-associated protein